MQPCTYRSDTLADPMLILLLLAVLIAALLLTFASRARGISTAGQEATTSAAAIGPSWLRSLIPVNPKAELVVAVIVAAIGGVGLVLLALSTTRQYAWAVFVLTPFAIGFVAGSLISCHRAPTRSRCACAGSVAVLTAGLGFFIIGAEGIICLLMAAPLAVPCAIAGALIAFLLQRSRRETLPATLGLFLCALPFVVTIEPALLSRPRAFTVQSVVEIDAPPAKVWTHLVQFEPIAAPAGDWWFRAGVSYPISATLRGHGVGAVRVCEFSTGTFVETIRTWQEPRELAFSVDRQPPPMREWTLYRDVHPPHLEGYFLPESADFRLVPLGDRRTRLEGTSVYRNRMWPGRYWRFWSDAIVRKVHRRVFEHVKRLAEADRRA
jgi:hypothetical protein